MCSGSTVRGVHALVDRPSTNDTNEISIKAFQVGGSLYRYDVDPRQTALMETKVGGSCSLIAYKRGQSLLMVMIRAAEGTSYYARE